MKQALQQGFTSRSRWLLQILGLTRSRAVTCLTFQFLFKSYLIVVFNIISYQTVSF